MRLQFFGFSAFRWSVCAIIVAFPLSSFASEGFAELLPRARDNDSEYRAAASARDAGLQARVAGRALLMPNASVTYEAGGSGLTREYSNGALPLSNEANSRSWTWRVSQPLFSLERWSTWKEEDARSILAELNFAAFETEMVLRLARAVFDTLLAVDSLRLARAQHTTMIAQRQDAENLRKAGVLTLTDVEDTRARELSAKAGEIEAEFGHQMRRRELERIVGVIGADSPKPINFGGMGPALPNDINIWLDRVRDANPKVVAATAALQLAAHGVARTKAAHYPTVDLVASGTRTQNPNSYTTLERSEGVAVRVTIPIFEGGRTESSAVRAAALREQSRQDLNTTVRDAEVKTTEAFLGLVNSSGKIDALAQALVAAKTSLAGATAGRLAGLRTHTEVLNAHQQVFSVERDLNKERYTYALASLQLKALAGQLKDEDFAALN